MFCIDFIYYKGGFKVLFFKIVCIVFEIDYVWVLDYVVVLIVFEVE